MAIESAGQNKVLVAIGQVARPFGVKGEMRIRSFSDSPESFERSAVLFVDETPFEVRSLRTHQGMVLVSLAGIDTPEQVRELSGKLVSTEQHNLPPKEEDEYYWYELIGMTVTTTQGRPLGTITGLTPTGANDVLHVQGPLGEVLLPLTEEVVKEVDTESRTMIVDPLEGLLPDD